MASKNDYSSHEKMYQHLKKTGSQGWGGETFAARMKQWQGTIENLLQAPDFPKPPAKLLEIGSGAGDLSLEFSKHGYQVSGIEISKTGVEWSTEKASLRHLSVNFYEGSASDLKLFSNASFEVVIDGNCLHCLIGTDRMKCLREIDRVLKPGGVFFVSTMVGDPKQEKAHFKFDSETRYQIQGGLPYRYMGHPDQIMAELAEAGFQVTNASIHQNEWWDHLTCWALKI